MIITKLTGAGDTPRGVDEAGAVAGMGSARTPSDGVKGLAARNSRADMSMAR